MNIYANIHIFVSILIGDVGVKKVHCMFSLADANVLYLVTAACLTIRHKHRSQTERVLRIDEENGYRQFTQYRQGAGLSLIALFLIH